MKEWIFTAALATLTAVGSAEADNSQIKEIVLNECVQMTVANEKSIQKVCDYNLSKITLAYHYKKKSEVLILVLDQFGRQVAEKQITKVENQTAYFEEDPGYNCDGYREGKDKLLAAAAAFYESQRPLFCN